MPRRLRPAGKASGMSAQSIRSGFFVAAGALLLGGFVFWQLRGEGKLVHIAGPPKQNPSGDLGHFTEPMDTPPSSEVPGRPIRGVHNWPAHHEKHGADTPQASTPPSSSGEFLPQPEPLEQPEKAPTIRTDLLDDPGFVAAVHEAGKATPDEDGALSSGRPPVIVGIGDMGFLPMLRNFIATSIERFTLRHYLVMALEEGMCDHVPKLGGAVTCVVWSQAGSIKKGDYGSPEFARLVNIKSEVVLAIVQLGYDALLVDGDIVFLQSPLPTLAELHDSFDLQIQDDAEAGRNSGFMLVKASEGGLTFIAEAVAVARADPTIRQQPAVNQAIKQSSGRFTVRVLPTQGFPCGKAFFESPQRRMWAWENPCRECVILHNNWIVGTAAKVFRFKESLQWLVDTDGYYSSTEAKYLQVGNPAASASKQQEEAMLKAAFAIGHALGRIVILPPLRCRGCDVYGLGGTLQGCSGPKGAVDECMLTAHYKLKDFTAAVGQDAFRERMFRYNPLTPEGVRLQFEVGGEGDATMQSPPEHQHAILAPGSLAKDSTSKTTELHSPAVPGKPTQAELRKWFGADDSPVLVFEHLYAVAPRLDEQAGFDSTWVTALVKGTLRQY